MISRILNFRTKLDTSRRRSTQARHRVRPNAESLERKDLLTGNFGHDLVFPALTEAQMNKLEKQPIYFEGGAAAVADLGAAGVTNQATTIELWVKPNSSGAIVSSFSEVKLPAVFQVAVPILSINADGKLVGGLVDSSRGKLYAKEVSGLHGMTLATPLQLSTSKSGTYTAGDPNTIISQNSIVDGNWHHIALVATRTSESLYLDGLLEGTHHGNFSLHFMVNALGRDGTATSTGGLVLGGTTAPRPIDNPYSATDYASGFSGAMDELRVWSVARPLAKLSLLSHTSLVDVRQNLPTLTFVDGFGRLHGVHTGILSGTSSVPIDAFPELQRLPGYQTTGLNIAAPFDDVTLTHNFSSLHGGKILERKVGLKVGDAISITIKGSDSNRLNEVFTVGIYDESGTVKVVTLLVNSSNAADKNTYTFVAPKTDTYKVGVYSRAAVGPAFVEYYVNPGSSNSLLELLSYSKSTTSDPVVTYRDINSLPNDTPLPADATRGNFPGYSFIPHGLNTTNAQLQAAYNAILNTPLAGGDSFATKYNLDSLYNVQGSNITNVDSVNKLQADINAIAQPAGVTADAFNSMKSFLTDLNKTRVNILKLIDTYTNLTTPVLDAVLSKNIPGTIAETIVNSQMQSYTKNNPPTLKFPDKPGFDVNQFLKDSAVEAAPKLLAAVANAVSPGAGAVVEPAVKILSQVFGFATKMEAPQPTIVVTPDQNNFADITKLSSSIQSSLADVNAQIKISLSSPAFRQVAMSNYGVLQLFSHANIKYSVDDIKTNLQAATTASTYAAWKQILPAAYHWQVELPVGKTTDGRQSFPTLEETSNPYAAYHRSSDVTSRDNRFAPGQIYTLQAGGLLSLSRPVGGGSTEVKYGYGEGYTRHDFRPSVADKRFNDAFGSGIPEGTVLMGSGSNFYTIAVANITEKTFDSDGLGSRKTTRTATYHRKVTFVVDWALQDSNGNSMSDDVATSLFGVKATPVVLGLGDAQTTLHVKNGGLYIELKPANGAVTTRSDAFLNWGVPTSSYKDASGNVSRVNPGVLLPRGSVNGTFDASRENKVDYNIDFVLPPA